jgi:hypothetical protein
MHIFSSRNLISSIFVFFESQILKPLSAQQKKVCAVAMAIFGVVGSGVLVYRCFLAKKQHPQFEQVKQSMQKVLKEEMDAKKEEALKKLEQAFEELQTIDPKKAHFAFFFSQILGRYGERIYPQFEQALPYLLASLQLQLQNLHLLPTQNFDKLTRLQDISQISPDTYANLIKFIQEADNKKYHSVIKRMSDEQKVHFAKTLALVGAIYSNLKEGYLKMARAPFLALITQLYRGVESIYLSMPQTPAIKEQLGELYYNIFPDLYLDECKLKGAVSKQNLLYAFILLNAATRYNSSIVMKARIANLKACRVFQYLKDIDEALKYVKESLALWKQVFSDSHSLTSNELERYGNLYANANNNYLSLMLKKENRDLSEMEQQAAIARDFYNKVKEAHPYSMIFANNLARFEKEKGNKKQALMYLDELESISQRYQAWPSTKGELEKAADLRKEIETS